MSETLCACGCGEQVRTRGRQFRPGHHHPHRVLLARSPKNPVSLRCRRCGREKNGLWPYQAENRASAEKDDLGQWWYICRSCQGSDQLHRARALLLLNKHDVTSPRTIRPRSAKRP